MHYYFGLLGINFVYKNYFCFFLSRINDTAPATNKSNDINTATNQLLPPVCGILVVEVLFELTFTLSLLSVCELSLPVVEGFCGVAGLFTLSSPEPFETLPFPESLLPGVDGSSGVSGSCGVSGISGVSGSCGVSGTSGTSG